MPNYGKEYKDLKARTGKHFRDHKKQKVRFGDCGCNKLHEEAEYNAQMSESQMKFGKARAFRNLFGNSPRLWEMQGPFYNTGYN
jgi:hypothetical protein